MSKAQTYSWLGGTFRDSEGAPSFKRQSVAVLMIALLFGIFLEIDAAYIDTLAFLIGAILGATGLEKFSKRPGLAN